MSQYRLTACLLMALIFVAALSGPASAQSRRGSSNWSLHAKGFGYGEGTRYHHQTFHTPSYGYGYGYGGWGGNPFLTPPYYTDYGGAAIYYPYGTGFNNFGFGVNQFIPYSYYAGPTGFNPYPPNLMFEQPALHPNLQEYKNKQDRLQQLNDPNIQLSKPILPSSDHARGEAANLVAQGKSLLSQQQFQRSLPKFKLAIQNAPDLAEPYFCMAANYLAINNADKAIEMIQRGLTQDPYWPFSNPTLSQFYGAENIALIEQVKTKVVEWTHDNVRDADRLFLLGLVLIFEQDFDNARLLLQTANALNLNGSNRQIEDLLAGIDSIQPVSQASSQQSPLPNFVSPSNSQSPQQSPATRPPENQLGPSGTFPDPVTNDDTRPATPSSQESTPPQQPADDQSSLPLLIPPLPAQSSGS